MLDFYFGDDPLEELEKKYKQKLEEALGIQSKKNEKEYLQKQMELAALKKLIEEKKASGDK